MTTRVIGRGNCPRCGGQGSVVFKEISGKIYVYFKHGRKWCYVGPLEAVNLSTMITNLSNYHYFTTKINDYVRNILGIGNMKISILVFTATLLIILAYLVSINTHGALSGTGIYLQTISQVLVASGIFVLLLAISLYEFRYKRRIQVRNPILHRNRVLKVLFTMLIVLLSLGVFAPLSSTIVFETSIVLEVEDHRVISFTHYQITLSCLMVTSLILFITTRSLSISNRGFTVTLLVSPMLASFVFYFLGIVHKLFFERSVKWISLTIIDLLLDSMILGLIIIGFSFIYIIAIGAFKRFLSLDIE